MYGVWCLFGLIIIAGGLGGLVYTLSAPTSHSFRIPFMDKEFDSGFLGHMLIGICGAFVAIGAAVPVIDLDLTIFEQTWDKGHQPNKLIPTVLYVIAIGVIGGFSGLRIISGLSDAMLQKLQSELDENRAKTSKLEQELQKNTTEDKKARDDYKLLEGNFLITIGRADEGVIHLEEYLSDFANVQNHKAWSWLAMGRKRCLDLPKAIEAIQKAISIDPSVWLYHYNYACYLAIQESPIEDIISEVKKALDFIPSDRANEIKDGVLFSDDDFAEIRNKQEFSELSSLFE